MSKRRGGKKATNDMEYQGDIEGPGPERTADATMLP